MSHLLVPFTVPVMCTPLFQRLTCATTMLAGNIRMCEVPDAGKTFEPTHMLTPDRMFVAFWMLCMQSACYIGLKACS